MKTKFPFLALGTLMIIATAWTSPGYQMEVQAANQSIMAAGPSAGSFAFFRTHRQGKGITATWGINSESGTVGFRLEKTYEDPNDPYAVWENVDYVSCNGSRSYKCTDNNVFPGNSSYRVVAEAADGSTIASPVSMVRIVSHK